MGQTAQQLTARLAAEQAGSRLPSVTAGLARDGELIWSAGRGRVGDRQPDSGVQYRAGSITKSFVAVAVLRLRDQGRFSLNDTGRVSGHGAGTTTPTSGTHCSASC